MEMFGSSKLGSVPFMLLCLGVWIVGPSPQSVLFDSGLNQNGFIPSGLNLSGWNEVLGQVPQVPASVTSYPVQEPVGLQNFESPALPSNQTPSQSSALDATGRFASVSDDLAATSTDIIAVEEVPLELSPEETLEIVEDACEVIDGVKVCVPPSLGSYMIEPYTRYREEERYSSYMPGDGDQLGWLTFGNTTWLRRGINSGVDANFNLHLLGGPEAVALPPRLYDFELGYQSRASLTEKFSYDAGLSVGVYSDFEDSARDGVRFPAHLVGMIHPNENWDWVLGVEYLDRDDIKILPVIGFVWHDTSLPGLRVEAVFPRPRIDLQIQRDMRLYWTARLGGGTWDIEMPDESNEVFTYRDYQILMGLERLNSEKSLTAWEFGFVFSRHIGFRNRPDEVNLDEAFVLRHVTRF